MTKMAKTVLNWLLRSKLAYGSLTGWPVVSIKHPCVFQDQSIISPLSLTYEPFRTVVLVSFPILKLSTHICFKLCCCCYYVACWCNYLHPPKKQDMYITTTLCPIANWRYHCIPSQQTFQLMETVFVTRINFDREVIVCWDILLQIVHFRYL